MALILTGFSAVIDPSMKCGVARSTALKRGEN